MARHNFRNLKIWQYGVTFASQNYKLTKTFPKSEIYNLTSQMNRCSVSIPSNIAEGSAKSTDKHFKSYLETSLGSAYEWETQLEIAKIENYVSETDYKELKDSIQQLQRMIGAFIDRLNN
ncbi:MULTISPECIES: four helix bundle protein [unclassified Dokdonia]|jgi:four helix bundle protein|uniref:four helix bundle protein n=1 Tax=unclassified Dokdonia TaxID=2615033 RepID=UPI00020A6FC8|nr:four helix bundle protein [Dokdonia sp. 4H-3-7-5]AEE20801.1 S23 ribosomal protein [Dokdonia sp. 4H-3-7-5]|tara:strand:- start:322823 stop:323182 length:360 start_codon:yes stop_codon:yes gene_type:complete